jgi:hypothetical protein
LTINKNLFKEAADKAAVGSSLFEFPSSSSTYFFGIIVWHKILHFYVKHVNIFAYFLIVHYMRAVVNFLLLEGNLSLGGGAGILLDLFLAILLEFF